MFKMLELDYNFSELEPYIDAQTMELHYDKHYRKYLENFNNAIKDRTEFDNLTIREIISDLPKISEDIRNTVRNNGGGYYNHTLFWKMLTPANKSKISDTFKTILVTRFGSMDAFYNKMLEAGNAQFGSGWIWLALKDTKELIITHTPNQDSPTMNKIVPILGIDVWEHAYYLKYQNRRPDYITAVFNIINWKYVEERYNKHIKKFSV